MARDPLWYKDAVVYQLHVKAFFDDNGDGMGDFAGLTQRLDYIRELGATAIWLLPFYPSPLRDDGYDISDYKAINPRYGTMGDFRAFVRAAHERDLRVITELVINHTSDQHPWFQRARRAKRGSSLRDFYVWSDTDTKYSGVRIIFTDSETSNWAWDPVAGQYYWHRFFSHQPDLNFENPHVIRAVIDVMRFWLATGIDGMRLDAVPYLCEREGTNCENLPETHGILKILRALLDAEFPDRVLLAEANQWPEDVRPYFGDGDECHMAFHFPLMPRMFMAIAEEDRYPILDIIRQTPDIPEDCQWAIFLRNHDEMTLEMVTERERDTMYRTYAIDPQARVNIGIRRRLAPLMENDRRRIELLTALLFSMPGTPIMYYGDEIGMGDNIFLGDRNAVRTPMQWSMDRNGGFSRADPARLYLPPIMDAVYGYAAVNVEAQRTNPSSLLNWLRRLIAVRQSYRSFGRGTLTLLQPANRKIIAYVREYGNETVLCVANLARSAQPLSLDLSRWKGRVPMEMLGWSPFPSIGDDRYPLTLGGHAFFWFLLAEPAPALWETGVAEPFPELQTLVLSRGGATAVDERARVLLESEILPSFIARERWYAQRGRLPAVRMIDAIPIGTGEPLAFAVVAAVDAFASGATSEVCLPLAVVDDVSPGTGTRAVRGALARTRSGHREGVLVDALLCDGVVLGMVEHVKTERSSISAHGAIESHGSERLRALTLPRSPTVRPLEIEQDNSSLIVGESVLVKVFRHLSPGPHPEVEAAIFLDRLEFPHVPALLGHIEYEGADDVARALAILYAYVESQGDAWSATLGYLERFFADRRARSTRDREPAADDHALFLERTRVLGNQVAALHRAFATATGDATFDPEPVKKDDLAGWIAEARETALTALRRLENDLVRLPPELHDAAWALIARRDEIMKRITQTNAALDEQVKTRHHADLHLGNVLVSPKGPLFVGVGGRFGDALERRRGKTSPLRDVARMLRSFNYAAVASVRGVAMDRSEDVRALEPLARDWEQRAAFAFRKGYEDAIAGCPSYPRRAADTQNLLDLFLIENAFIEIDYELTHRPSWVRIPLEGLARVFDSQSADPFVTSGPHA